MANSIVTIVSAHEFPHAFWSVLIQRFIGIKHEHCYRAILHPWYFDTFEENKKKKRNLLFSPPSAPHHHMKKKDKNKRITATKKEKRKRGRNLKKTNLCFINAIRRAWNKVEHSFFFFSNTNMNTTKNQLFAGHAQGKKKTMVMGVEVGLPRQKKRKRGRKMWLVTFG